MDSVFLRLGHFLYRHRWPAIATWAVVLLVAIPVAPRVLSVLGAGGFSSPDLEAARGGTLLAERFHSDPATLYIVYRDPSGRLSASSSEFEAMVEASLANVRALPDVASVTPPRENPRQIAPDDKAAYATIALRTEAENSRETLPEVRRALATTALDATLTGTPIFYEDIYDVTERDLRRAELISIPFASAALLLVFGSVVAAAIPALVGGAAVTVTLAAMVGLARVTDLSIFSLNLTTMLGLGLGIDYSLFIVSRFREERLRRGSVEDAVAAAVATAGRAVLFSGATVFAGMLGLLVFRFNALRSLGIAGALVVAISVLAALTLLPGVLGVLGPRVDWLALRRPPAGASDRDGRSSFWSRLAQIVMAHPLATLAPLLVLLIGLGLPFLRVEMGAPDASILPTDVQSRRGADLLQAHWGAGELSPALLAFQTIDGGSPRQPDRIGALYDFLQRVAADPRVARVQSIVTIDPRISRAQYQLMYGSTPERITDVYARASALTTVRDDTVVAQVTSRYGQTDPRSKDLIRAIRATPAPPGFRLLVSGPTAAVLDYTDTLYTEFPRAALLVVGAIYVVLLLTFRSVVIPLKAIVMNTLSILASYGALVVIFQEGALSNVLGFQPPGFVEASLPIVLFCVLFGLSMDYEVFLLSRVKEAHDAGYSNRASVASGLERSGRIITSAAAIVVLVSLSFVAADIVLIKALGLGTAIAVFLDATVVRALLVPATMRLLGDWNWWSPRWLTRLRWVGARAG